MDSFRFESTIDAFPIQGYVWRVNDPRAVVAISHGAAEHALRYERFALALNAAGIEVWACDQRGHGQSPGTAGLGDFGEGGWDALVADIGQLIELVRDEHPQLPVILFGHSMGSFAAQQFCLQGSDRIDALVLSGSTAPEARRRAPASARGARPGFNASFEPGRTQYDWLSRDEAEVDKYIADPLCGFESRARQATPSRWDPDRLADAQALRGIRGDLPVLLVAGDQDPINRNLEGLRILERRWHEAGVKRIDTQYYEGGRHEMLNEINRDEVTQDIVGWLDEIVKGKS